MNPTRAFLTLAAVGALLAPAVHAQDVDLNSEGRRPAEIARDASSKPVEVLEWIGLEEGATVADILAGTGYHSWIFAQWVGPEGHVYSQHSPARADTLKARIESGDLATGYVHYVERISELPEGLDLAFTDRNYHDFPVDQVPTILAAIHSKVKPGGLFVVIDARATEGRDTEAHRIADDVIVQEVTAAGFELVEKSELLANPADDHVGGDFENRDSLDRSLIKFRKPAGEHEGHGGR
jgi:predicted methyltransferase